MKWGGGYCKDSHAIGRENMKDLVEWLTLRIKLIQIGNELLSSEDKNSTRILDFVDDFIKE